MSAARDAVAAREATAAGATWSGRDAAFDRRARRLPVDPGPAGWNRLLPERRPRPPLDGAVEADWLVVGAGFAGLAAARRLHELAPGTRTVLLEASAVADGPAGRNSGFMIDLPHDLGSADYRGTGAVDDRMQTRMNRAAIDFAETMARRYRMPPEAAVRSGKVNAAASEAGERLNRDYAAHLAALGEPHETLDARAMTELTGTRFYRGGLRTPGTLMLQPAFYARALADGLAGEGAVQLHERSPVLRLTRERGRWRAETPGGTASAPKAVLAVNGHAESFGLFPGRLLHVFTYASMTEALAPEAVRRLGGERSWGLTPADPMGTTVRRVSGAGGERIVVRNRFTCDPDMTVPDGRLERVARDHDRAFRARFPVLGDVPMAYRWGGRLCLSRNGVPAFGEVEDGLYAACCQNGLGAARGTFAGMMAAELACGTGHPMLAEMRAFAAPARLPPRSLAALGANAAMRWREWRAGVEL